jgi:hypothetical protein
VDGIGDCESGAVSAPGDGIPNYIDIDSDGDGFTDGSEGAGSCGAWTEDYSGDIDADGTLNVLDYCDCNGENGDLDGDTLFNGTEDDFGLNKSDKDSDGDTVLDPTEVTAAAGVISDAFDTDGDTIPDALDTDDDDDSIPTSEEVEDTDSDGYADVFPDTDEDDVFDYLDPDDDGDGVDTIDEILRDNSVDGKSSADVDGDGVPNYLDFDDFDGPLEDRDLDGLRNGEEEITLKSKSDSADSDDDGVPDDVEVGSVASPQDSDKDTIYDINDDDDDGDGHLTKDEGAYDADGDGVPNYLDTDSDGDGLTDEAEGTADDDGDNIPDWLDADPDDGPNSDVHDAPPVEEPEPVADDIKSCSTVAPGTLGVWASLAGLAGLMLRRRKK